MPPSDSFSPRATARRLLRTGVTGTLATLDAETGGPFASLVTTATDCDGSPLLLLSDLAAHTVNLKADSRASLLLSEIAAGDPLTGARLTLTGAIARDPGERPRRRFLARHPEAEGYAGFADFAIYRMRPHGGHLVAGFGRIHRLDAAQLLSDLTGSDALIAAEAEIVSHMNEDHADALALYATRLLGCADGAWRMTGCDPDGIDLMSESGAARLEFAEPAPDPATMRQRLVACAKAARTP